MSTHRVPDDGGPVFPIPSAGLRYEGISLRDWFAGQAMAGEFASQGPYGNWINSRETHAKAAGKAYLAADAMLEARDADRIPQSLAGDAIDALTDLLREAEAVEAGERTPGSRDWIDAVNGAREVLARCGSKGGAR